MSVLVFGSLNLDLVTYADKLPAIGETIVGEKLLKFPGGKGLNQAIAARRAGSEVLMVGSIGNDLDGNFLFDILKSENINHKFITKTSEQTGIAVIEVSKSGENRIIIIAGANSKTKFSDEVLTSSPLVTVSLAQLETPIIEVAKFIQKSKATGKITILNPAPIQKLDEALLQDTDYLIANEIEASFLVGKAVEHLSKDEAVIIAKLRCSKTSVITSVMRSSELSSMPFMVLITSALGANKLFHSVRASLKFWAGIAKTIIDEWLNASVIWSVALSWLGKTCSPKYFLLV